jgi:putative flippase GtrA
MIRPILRSLVDSPVATQLRRFVVVGTVAAGVQLLLLWGAVDVAGWNYLLGAAVAIETTIVLQYVLNNAWTFRAKQNTGTVTYLLGLAKTNLVRGSAIPIQLGFLYVLVEGGIWYLPANVVAIGGSGLYRFLLDARWTWAS